MNKNEPITLDGWDKIITTNYEDLTIRGQGEPTISRLDQVILLKKSIENKVTELNDELEKMKHLGMIAEIEVQNSERLFYNEPLRKHIEYPQRIEITILMIP